jgi:hypothetical protein
VSPLKDEGLCTKFIFSTDLADDFSSDCPLPYKYGYRNSDHKHIHFFSASNVDLEVTIVLPAGKTSVFLYMFFDLYN